MTTGQPWAVIWDVDGTMVDTAELHFQAWAELARERHLPFSRADFAGTFGWRNAEIIPKVFGPHHSAAEVAALGDRKEELYRAQASKGVALLPGARALMEAIQAAGGLQAIGSSAPRRNLELMLQLTGTAALFTAISAMEDTTRGKPAPDVFLLAARRLDVPPARCVVLEDAPVGVQAAKAGGMHAVGITFVGHHPAEKLHAAGADLVVASLEKVNVTILRELVC
jgi:beta-phosphoglucomutase